MYNTEDKVPIENELPSEYADRLGVFYSSLVTSTHKKSNGQFFTPIAIARLMASFCVQKKNQINILDPGCGTAILTCAIVEHLIKNNSMLNSIEIVAYETDSSLIPYTKNALQYLQKWIETRNKKIIFKIIEADFIISNVGALDIGYDGERFDIVISNPPYFKLSKNDVRTLAANPFLKGQPNIYSIFMAISSKILSVNGELIFITPRSFASGNYFKTFREFFFKTVQIENIHLFLSRKDTFNRDKVLQETVIIKAVKEQLNPNKKVNVSSSFGVKDILKPAVKKFNSSDLIDIKSNGMILHLPTNQFEENILHLVSSWNKVLIDFDIHISTGPVVSFRTLKFLQNNFDHGETCQAPLFWLHNVQKMILEWPKEFKEKQQFIRIEHGSKSILIPNKNYIFLRRFSTKDDKSRLIASPYFCNYFKSDLIGVENKVNYIYRKNGHLDRNETVGLCALLNSEIFDTYFQIFNGNVNVSATELRIMKFPPEKDIIEIGSQLILSNDFTMINVNTIVNKILKKL